MSTPLSSSTPYCDGDTFVVFHDWRNAADLLVDDDTRLADQATVAADSTLGTLLLAASGEIEAALLTNGKYTPTDLQTLTGASQCYLQKLTADLAFWRLIATGVRLAGRQQAPYSAERGRRGLGAAGSACAGARTSSVCRKWPTRAWPRRSTCGARRRTR